MLGASSQVRDTIARRAAEMAAADPDFMQRPLAKLNAEAAAYHKADDLVSSICKHGWHLARLRDITGMAMLALALDRNLDDSDCSPWPGQPQLGR